MVSELIEEYPGNSSDEVSKMIVDNVKRYDSIPDRALLQSIELYEGDQTRVTYYLPEKEDKEFIAEFDESY